MNAFHISFTFPQPGTMTVIAKDFEDAKAKLNAILNASYERVVTIKDVVNFKDVPELQAVILQQDADKKAMEAEFQRIIDQHAADEEALKAAKEAAQAVVEVTDEVKTIN